VTSGGASKNILGSLSLAIFYGPLINYGVIRPLFLPQCSSIWTSEGLKSLWNCFATYYAMHFAGVPTDRLLDWFFCAHHVCRTSGRDFFLQAWCHSWHPSPNSLEALRTFVSISTCPPRKFFTCQSTNFDEYVSLTVPENRSWCLIERFQIGVVSR